MHQTCINHERISTTIPHLINIFLYVLIISFLLFNKYLMKYHKSFFLCWIIFVITKGCWIKLSTHLELKYQIFLLLEFHIFLSLEFLHSLLEVWSYLYILLQTFPRFLLYFIRWSRRHLINNVIMLLMTSTTSTPQYFLRLSPKHMT